MSASLNTPQSVIERAEKFLSRLAPVLQPFERWGTWETQIKAIIAAAPRRPEVSVSLVGGTGAGKSTLVNALLEARVLPVGNMKACTAAISEVSYSEEPRYTADVEFVPRSAWEREVEALIGDLKDSSEHSKIAPEDETARSSAEPSYLASTARDKLWTVYGAPGSDPAHLNVANLVEPTEIRAALDRGIQSLKAENLDEFRKQISLYLDSKHRFWPIVKTVKIKGPFPALECGAKLIDLPGINDPNEAREAITKEHLKTCRYVWIVFNIKRVLMKDLTSLMQSPEFIRQVVLDGRANALTLVATASDDIDYDVALENYKLPDDSAQSLVIECRNREAVDEVHRQLEGIAIDIASRADGDGAALESLQNQFRSSEIFTTSAKEYLRIRHLYRGSAAGLETVEQTQLPVLRSHLANISSAYGVEAKARAEHKQLSILFKEMEREVASRKLALKRGIETSQAQREEVIRAANAAQRFLSERLKEAEQLFDEGLAESRKQFEEALTRAIREAELELVRVRVRWECMYWSTIRAVARRNGVFHGSTGRHDFPGDIADPILDKITFAWAEFFGNKLSTLLERSAIRLEKIADAHRRELLDVLQRISNDEASRGSLEKIGETTAAVLTELLSQTQESMKDKIDRVRRSLHDRIPDQIRANMRAAFELAAEEHGRGMKARMIDRISGHAKKTAKVMFEDARAAVLEGIGGLADSLIKREKEMSNAVTRQSGLMIENVTNVSPGLSAEQIAREAERLSNAEEGLRSVSTPLAVGA